MSDAHAWCAHLNGGTQADSHPNGGALLALGEAKHISASTPSGHGPMAAKPCDRSRSIAHRAAGGGGRDQPAWRLRSWTPQMLRSGARPSSRALLRQSLVPIGTQCSQSLGAHRAQVRPACSQVDGLLFVVLCRLSPAPTKCTKEAVLHSMKRAQAPNKCVSYPRHQDTGLAAPSACNAGKVWWHAACKPAVACATCEL